MAGVNAGHIIQAGRHIALAAVVVSPGGHRAVILQSQTMGLAGGDRSDVAQIRGHITLPLVVAAPGHQAAISF